MLLTAVVVWSLLALNLSVSCYYIFDCAEYQPPISYVTAFKFYDRVACFAWALYAVICLSFFSGAYAYYREFLGE